MIYEAVDPNANIIFGALVDDSMEGEIAITVIATGFPIGKSEGEEKLSQMQQQAQGSGGSVRTVGDAVRAAAESKQQQLQAQRRGVSGSKKSDADDDEDITPRVRQRISDSQKAGQDASSRASVRFLLFSIFVGDGIITRLLIHLNFMFIYRSLQE